MAKPRIWKRLSADYRGRLARQGISQADYEAGASLSHARGHGKTPEHPSQAIRNPERYQEYLGKHTPSGPSGPPIGNRSYWVRKFSDNMSRQLGHYMKFNRTKVREHAQITDESSDFFISMDELMAGATAESEEELVELRESFSDSNRVNPFFYH